MFFFDWHKNRTTITKSKKTDNMKILKHLSVIVLILCTVSSNSQTTLNTTSQSSRNYNTAIGLRGGGTSGLTIKQFVNGSQAIEGILGIWNNGFGATLLWEKYVNAFNVDGLNWYYGAGGHAAFWSSDFRLNNGNNRYDYADNDMGLGVDGIVGIEYAIPNIPFAISLDVKPFVEVTTNGNTWVAIDPGLEIKLKF